MPFIEPVGLLSSLSPHHVYRTPFLRSKSLSAPHSNGGISFCFLRGGFSRNSWTSLRTVIPGVLVVKFFKVHFRSGARQDLELHQHPHDSEARDTWKHAAVPRGSLGPP